MDRRARLLFLLALAAALAAFLPREDPPGEPLPPARADGSFPSAAGAAFVNVGQPAVPPLAAPRAVEKLAEKPPPPPAPVAVVPPATLPEPAVEPPAAAAAQPSPASVFGWGPWSGAGSPSANAADAPGHQERGAPSASGFTQTVSAPGGLGSPTTNPPGVTAPPVIVPPADTKPGHGFGDRNHTHIHQRR